MMHITPGQYLATFFVTPVMNTHVGAPAPGRSKNGASRAAPQVEAAIAAAQHRQPSPRARLIE
jgi:hypothetical protein